MSTVSRSASQSAVKLFGTISVAADTLSSTINSMGDVATVLQTKTKAWVASEQRRAIMVADNERERIKSEVAIAQIQQEKEVAKLLATPAEVQAYKAVMDKLEKKLADAGL